jgi:hypothetical protein
LLQFLGKVALPPWRDEHGEWVGKGVDCAPIATEIAEWIDAQDLADAVEGPAYYPPPAGAAEVAEFLRDFADRYPYMWPTTRQKILRAAESLRYQVRRGYG